MGPPEGNHLELRRNSTPAELEASFPKLKPGNYEISSKATPRYNCLAFANKDERHWWESGLNGGLYYWPPGIAQNDKLETILKIFANEGYELTDNHDVEVGVEKVAIYVSLDDMLPSHYARSEDGAWKSKLGKDVDIKHTSLDVLEGDKQDEYGIVERVLKRVTRS